MPKKDENFEPRTSNHFGARLGRLVRSYREDLGISAKELARRLWEDVGRASSIYRLEAGKVRNPQAGTVQLYALKLDIPQEEIDALRDDCPEPSVFEEINRLRRDLHLGRTDPPATTASCLRELKAIDDKLLNANLSDDDRYVQNKRRKYLIDHLQEGFERKAEPERHAQAALQLVKVKEWNNGAFRRQMADYFVPINALLERAENLEEKDFLELVLLATENFYLNGEKEEGHGLIQKFRDRILNPVTSEERELVLANADIPLESGHLLPTHYEELAGPQEGPLGKAGWWRCRACRLARNDNLDGAQEAHMKACRQLARVPPDTPGRANIAAYLDAMRVILEWRKFGVPTPELEQQTRAALRDIQAHTKFDDAIIFAALNHLLLEIKVARHLQGDDPNPNLVEIEITAHAIVQLLSKSVPDYCLFRVDRIMQSASLMAADPQSFIRSEKSTID